jgi:hypothetical protein
MKLFFYAGCETILGMADRLDGGRVSLLCKMFCCFRCFNHCLFHSIGAFKCSVLVPRCKNLSTEFKLYLQVCNLPDTYKIHRKWLFIFLVYIFY